MPRVVLMGPTFPGPSQTFCGGESVFAQVLTEGPGLDASQPENTSRLSAALADRYAVARELGSGGMATVYLAQDLRHERQVAVKVLRPDLAATLGPERFHREIKIAANLQHPHILPLLDSGEADDFLYYVMPYVEGQSLRDKLAEGRAF